MTLPTIEDIYGCFKWTRDWLSEPSTMAGFAGAVTAAAAVPAPLNYVAFGLSVLAIYLREKGKVHAGK